MTSPTEAAQHLKSLEDAEVAKSHILMFASRVAAAMSAIREGNLGSARALLEIGKLDYSAAINALPEV